MYRVAGQVIRIVDHVGSIIALEHQHELQIIAQVVRSQAQGGRQFLLVDTTGYTTDKTHFRTVIEPHAVQRLDE